MEPWEATIIYPGVPNAHGLHIGVDIKAARRGRSIAFVGDLYPPIDFCSTNMCRSVHTINGVVDRLILNIVEI